MAKTHQMYNFGEDGAPLKARKSSRTGLGCVQRLFLNPGDEGLEMEDDLLPAGSSQTSRASIGP